MHTVRYFFFFFFFVFGVFFVFRFFFLYMYSSAYTRNVTMSRKRYQALRSSRGRRSRFRSRTAGSSAPSSGLCSTSSIAAQRSRRRGACCADRRSRRDRDLPRVALRRALAHPLPAFRFSESTSRASRPRRNSSPSSVGPASSVSDASAEPARDGLTSRRAGCRMRERHISTFDLIDEDEIERGLAEAERTLPETVEFELRWLVAVGSA